MILRTIVCDVCGNEYRESGAGDGFPGWSGINGVALDGIHDPKLCPECTKSVMNFVDSMKERMKANGMD